MAGEFASNEPLDVGTTISGPLIEASSLTADYSINASSPFEESPLAFPGPFRITRRRMEVRSESSYRYNENRRYHRILPMRRSGDEGSGSAKSTKDDGEGESGGGWSSGYTGCLSMTSEELEAAWKWPSEMPVCSGGISDPDMESPPAFSLSDCDSFSNLWLWDLALTCEDIDSLDGCKCEFASEHFRAGDIVCTTNDGSSPCPEKCNVCNTCMTLLGCKDAFHNLEGAKRYSSLLLYLLAAALGITMGALGLFTTRRRRGKLVSGNTGLPANLLELPPITAIHTNSGIASSRVWLAPVTK